MKTFASTVTFPSLPPMRIAAPSLAGRNRVAVCWSPGKRRQRA
jgi:hypothetical protein